MPRAKRKPSQQLRLILDQCHATQDPSVNEVCRATGIGPAVLSRFRSGEHDLRLSKVDLLCEFFDLELVRRRK